jgi:hypothetical protein
MAQPSTHAVTGAPLFRRLLPQHCESDMAQAFSLPIELEREIFEAAARRHFDLIPTLLRVCHRVHVWRDPFFIGANLLH